MDERILEQLENIPCLYADALTELIRRVNLKVKEKGISAQEKQRLEYELEIIRQTDTAKLFLFGLEVASSCNTCVVLGAENNSFVNYILGISNVNPTLYNLPFERFFNHKRKILPIYNFYVKKGYKGHFLKEIYKKFGQGSISKALDNNDLYFVCANGMDSHLIKNATIIANKNQQVYSETISVLLAKELLALNYYSFFVGEYVEVVKTNTDQKFFSEEDILKTTHRIFGFEHFDFPKYKGIKEVENILKSTNQQLIYQEQLMDILQVVSKCSMSEADNFRIELVKRKKENLQALIEMLIKKYGNNGKRLFYYLYKNAVFLILKAYIIATMQTDVEF